MKRYTAQEMREQAAMHDKSAKEVLKDCENEGGSTHCQLYPLYAEYEAKTAAMLRYAAGVVERCENVIAKFQDTVSPEIAEIADYIKSDSKIRYDEFLRGDAKKESEVRDE